LVSTFVNKFINHDVKNTINLDKDKVDSFSKSVLERFSNPYIRHLLYSIMLNSVSKYKARILPSYLESKKNGIVPIYSMFALAGLFVLYYRATDDKGESVVLNDENVFLELFNTLRAKKDINRALNTFLSLEYWDTTELSSDAELINKYVSEILLKGSAKALKDLL
ncbi:MAG: hypothetical protein LBV51_02790, partial [Acholeplasmatales bacterium]|nr:hypothetical protein [Acholeplasmatales bacterium]